MLRIVAYKHFAGISDVVRRKATACCTLLTLFARARCEPPYLWSLALHNQIHRSSTIVKPVQEAPKAPLDRMHDTENVLRQSPGVSGDNYGARKSFRGSTSSRLTSLHRESHRSLRVPAKLKYSNSPMITQLTTPCHGAGI
jgi:hypothetical protein